MRADGAHVPHFPRPRLVAIGAAGQGAHRTDVDAHAAFVTVQMIPVVGRDLGDGASIDDAERVHSQALIADAHAAITEYTARRVIEDHRRELLLVNVVLDIGEPALARPVSIDHVLKLAFAALVANRTVERMVDEQKLQHCLAGFDDLFHNG